MRTKVSASQSGAYSAAFSTAVLCFFPVGFALPRGIWSPAEARVCVPECVPGTKLVWNF